MQGKIVSVFKFFLLSQSFVLLNSLVVCGAQQARQRERVEIGCEFRAGRASNGLQ